MLPNKLNLLNKLLIVSIQVNKSLYIPIIITDVTEKSRAYETIFPAGGILIPDDTVLSNASPGTYSALVTDNLFSRDDWLWNIGFENVICLFLILLCTCSQTRS